MTNSSRQASPKMLLFISCVFVVVGGGIFLFGVRSLLRAKESVNWPSTFGEIVQSSVESSRSSGSNSSTTYKAEVLYEYMVKAVTYNGNRVAFGDYGSSNPSHARKIVNRYPKDTKVLVYYMPENPEEAVLEAGIKKQAFFLPAFGLFFMLGGVLVYSVRKKTLKRIGKLEEI